MSTRHSSVSESVFDGQWVFYLTVMLCVFALASCNKAGGTGGDSTAQREDSVIDTSTDAVIHGTDDNTAIKKDSLTGGDSVACEHSAKKIGPDIDWIKVPAGTFIWGSKPGSPAFVAAMNTEVEVVLTNSFEMAATEITVEQWLALDYLAHRADILSRTYDRPPSDSYPMNRINFFEALTWCNKLSALHNLEECYDLSDCSIEQATCNVEAGGEICQDSLLICGEGFRKFKDIYSCKGYRLPSIAEWQYAAKAGTNTHTYAGDYTLNSHGKVPADDPVANRVGWNIYNSDNHPHPVAQKEPNPWGFYDILGNVEEWVDWFDGSVIYRNDSDEPVDPVGTFVDPIGANQNNPSYKQVFTGTMGGYYRSYPRWMTPTFPAGTNAKYTFSGFRPVRTLFEK
ncbi:MAG: formylglycine-generating enzyme family protein [Deltaproteobacteria bacterium]|nr:formylglycine-generating enzyme family protein [Deltaproteobacteria bacterium]